MVQEVGLRYKELNPNNKVNYHIHIETEDTEIFYDADMITIILDNLMSNAAKYTSEGDDHLITPFSRREPDKIHGNQCQ